MEARARETEEQAQQRRADDLQRTRAARRRQTADENQQSRADRRERNLAARRRETREQTERRQAAVRERVRAARQAQAEARRGTVYSNEEVEQIATAPLEAPSESRLRSIFDDAQISMGDAEQGERVCAVCDQLVLKSESVAGAVCRSFADRLKARCSERPEMKLTGKRKEVREYYRPFSRGPLRDVMLSPTAFAEQRAVAARGGDSTPAVYCVCRRGERWHERAGADGAIVRHAPDEAQAVLFPACHR